MDGLWEECPSTKGSIVGSHEGVAEGLTWWLRGLRWGAVRGLSRGLKGPSIQLRALLAALKIWGSPGETSHRTGSSRLALSNHSLQEAHCQSRVCSRAVAVLWGHLSTPCPQTAGRELALLPTWRSCGPTCVPAPITAAAPDRVPGGVSSSKDKPTGEKRVRDTQQS